MSPVVSSGDSGTTLATTASSYSGIGASSIILAGTFQHTLERTLDVLERRLGVRRNAAFLALIEPTVAMLSADIEESMLAVPEVESDRDVVRDTKATDAKRSRTAVRNDGAVRMLATKSMKPCSDTKTAKAYCNTMLLTKGSRAPKTQAAPTNTEREKMILRIFRTGISDVDDFFVVRLKLTNTSMLVLKVTAKNSGAINDV